MTRTAGAGLALLRHKEGSTVEDEKYLYQKLEWVKYRMDRLDQMEAKLVEMKQLAEVARDNKLSSKEIRVSNAKLHKLQQEVIEIDEQSKIFWLEAQ
jgi:hypothetical protein